MTQGPEISKTDEVEEVGQVASSKAASEIIEQIVHRGGHILSQHELQRRLIHNAWEVTQEVACSRLQMCFVPHDEEQNTWTVEEDEPLPPARDIWLRKQIEVLKDEDNQAEIAEVKLSPRMRRRKTRVKAYAPRLANRRQSLLLHQSRVTPLSACSSVEDREDEEVLRQVWLQRSARRANPPCELSKREQAALRQEQERRRLELQVIQHEKGTTPSTQGEGAVEAADNEPGEDPFRDNEEVERLPKMMDSIRFDVRSVKATPRTDLEEASACAASNEENAKLLEPMSEVVADGFVRSDACQPSPWAMRLQPGVVLEWRGRKKTGPCGPTAGVWKVYKGHTEEPRVDENETSRGTALDGRSRENDQEATDSPERVPELRGAWRQGLPPRPASAHAILGCRSDSSIAASLVSKTPATALNTAFGWLEQGKSGGAPSKVQGRICAPPPQRERPSSALPRRSESCTGALGPGPQGVLRSQPRQPRQKVPLLGGTGAIVQPPLGATMGHGLLPAERNLREAVKKGEFYYPATSQVKVDQVRVTRAGSASLSRTRSAHALERGTSTRGTSTRAAWR